MQLYPTRTAAHLAITGVAMVAVGVAAVWLLLGGHTSLSGQIRELGSEALVLRDGEDDWIVRRSMITAAKTKEARDRPSRPVV